MCFLSTKHIYLVRKTVFLLVWFFGTCDVAGTCSAGGTASCYVKHVVVFAFKFVWVRGVHRKSGKDSESKHWSHTKPSNVENPNMSLTSNAGQLLLGIASSASRGWETVTSMWGSKYKHISLVSLTVKRSIQILTFGAAGASFSVLLLSRTLCMCTGVASLSYCLLLRRDCYQGGMNSSSISKAYVCWFYVQQMIQ